MSMYVKNSNRPIRKEKGAWKEKRRKEKENKTEEERKKENSTELQKPNVEAEVYNKNRKCD